MNFLYHKNGIHKIWIKKFIFIYFSFLSVFSHWKTFEWTQRVLFIWCACFCYFIFNSYHYNFHLFRRPPASSTLLPENGKPVESWNLKEMWKIFARNSFSYFRLWILKRTKNSISYSNEERMRTQHSGNN